MDHLDPRKDTVGQRSTEFSRTSLFLAGLSITATMTSDALVCLVALSSPEVSLELLQPITLPKGLSPI